MELSSKLEVLMSEISKQENQITLFYKQLSEAGSLTSSMEDYLQNTRLALQKRKAELMEEFQPQVSISNTEKAQGHIRKIHSRALTTVENVQEIKKQDLDQGPQFHKRHNSIQLPQKFVKNEQEFESFSEFDEAQDNNEDLYEEKRKIMQDDLDICQEIFDKAKETVRIIKMKFRIIKEREKNERELSRKQDLLDVAKAAKPPLSPLKLVKLESNDDEMRKIVWVM